MTKNNSINTIAILQYNLHKNLSRTDSILSDPSSSRFTLIIQEQHWSKHTESALIHGSWTLTESQSYLNRNPQSAILNINNRILDTSLLNHHLPLPRRHSHSNQYHK